ncbi:hypothetical protein CAOG_000715 [Capsaspora owczarzaki ATCC 30864]|uniref:Uncharacterized protein n=2 Tax=Capsaspora owczarzaki (strain ATCC 30864) TaxID=595528 RepID=A0A0D2WHR2_CAPO3|nr:hypothetical protein CAOG_000715 [Capsaspora owczarzaki ATCC 30864]
MTTGDGKSAHAAVHAPHSSSASHHVEPSTHHEQPQQHHQSQHEQHQLRPHPHESQERHHEKAETMEQDQRKEKAHVHKRNADTLAASDEALERAAKIIEASGGAEDRRITRAQAAKALRSGTTPDAPTAQMGTRTSASSTASMRASKPKAATKTKPGAHKDERAPKRTEKGKKAPKKASKTGAKTKKNADAAQQAVSEDKAEEREEHDDSGDASTPVVLQGSVEKERSHDDAEIGAKTDSATAGSSTPLLTDSDPSTLDPATMDTTHALESVSASGGHDRTSTATEAAASTSADNTTKKDELDVHNRNAVQAMTMNQHQHSAMRTSEEAPKARNLEHGRIFFFYRPKVMLSEAQGMDDVQRFHILLCPETGSLATAATADMSTHKTVKRVINVGRKHLPNIGKHETVWAFVSKASVELSEVEAVLEKEQYSTKTIGERTVEGERPAGEGVYALVDVHGHSHLVYSLQLPRDLGDVQHSFNIGEEGSFLMQVRNPFFQPTDAALERAGSQRLGLSDEDKVAYPQQLIDKFEGKRWAPVRDTRMLDFDNVELLLIGAHEDVAASLGAHGQAIVDASKVRVNPRQVLQELGLQPREHPIAPVLTGDWK